MKQDKPGKKAASRQYTLLSQDDLKVSGGAIQWPQQGEKNKKKVVPESDLRGRVVGGTVNKTVTNKLKPGKSNFGIDEIFRDR